MQTGEGGPLAATPLPLISRAEGGEWYQGDPLLLMLRTEGEALARGLFWWRGAISDYSGGLGSSPDFPSSLSKRH